MRRSLARPVLLSLLLAAVTAAPAHAGPAWISIEYPANPHSSATRGALFIVHVYHHAQAMTYPVLGRAEGIVDGRRVSMPVQVSATPDGTYAVRWQQPKTGAWVLVMDLDLGKDDGASAIVGMEGSRVASVEVPSGRRGEWTVPHTATQAEIDAVLRARVAMSHRASAGRLATFGAPLALAGLAALLRRRRR